MIECRGGEDEPNVPSLALSLFSNIQGCQAMLRLFIMALPGVIMGVIALVTIRSVMMQLINTL